MLKRLLLLAISTALAFSLAGCAAEAANNAVTEITDSTSSPASAKEDVTTTAATTALTEATTVQTEPPEPDIRTVHIVCAGDNLIHSSIYNQAKRRAAANDEDGYDFDYVYEKIEKYLEGADIAILNQETIVTDELEPSD